MCGAARGKKKREKQVCRSQHASVCRFTPSPCVPAKQHGPWTCCRYKLKRFESAHGGVMGFTHAGRESQREERGRGREQGQTQKKL